jgi:methionyl-tRNA formyltransferase
VRLVFAGTPDTAVRSLEALLASRHEVVAVVTRPDARAGRGRALTASPVRQVAAERGLEVLTPGRPGDPDFLDRLRTLEPECVPVVAYGALVPGAALDIPRHGWVNLHFSLLPAWRGAAPVQWSVMAGDEVTGATTFLLEEGLDTGPVYGSLTEPVRADDTAGSLLDRLSAGGAGLLVATLDGIEAGSLRPTPQPGTGVSHAPKLTAPQARVRWDLPSYVIDRRIRGCSPAPGAWTTFRGERFRVGPLVVSTREGTDLALAPGELRATARSVLVGTASGPVELNDVGPPGKARMAAADWARGARITAGECFDG